MKDTVIHRLDPRTKLYFAITVTIISLCFNEIVPLAILFLLLVPLFKVGKIFNQWLKTLRGLVFIAIFIIVIDSLFISFSLGVAMSIRLMVLISAFSLFFLTVHPDDFSQSLIQIKVPFSFAFALSLAIRFVPTLAQEAQNVREAQMVRGLELQKGNFIQKVRNFIPIIIPLIILSIQRALLIAESLESRGFGAVKQRTYLYPLKMKFKDFFIIGILTLLLISVIVLIFTGLLPDWFHFHLPF